MKIIDLMSGGRAAARFALPLAASAFLAACVTPPPRTVRVAAPPPPPPAPVYVYPAKGQSPEQTDRDKYECHLWAVQQTGVDPSRPGAPTYERVVVQPATPAPGSGTVAGAVGGAILGSIIAGPRAAGAGFLLGGVTGAVVGTAAEQSANANAQAQAQQAQAQANAANAADAAQGRARAESYRRAIGACLQGRGYTVS
jgi:hypothetical protein